MLLILLHRLPGWVRCSKYRLLRLHPGREAPEYLRSFNIAPATWSRTLQSLYLAKTAGYRNSNCMPWRCVVVLFDVSMRNTDRISAMRTWARCMLSEIPLKVSTQSKLSATREAFYPRKLYFLVLLRVAPDLTSNIQFNRSYQRYDPIVLVHSAGTLDC